MTIRTARRGWRRLLVAGLVAGLTFSLAPPAATAASDPVAGAAVDYRTDWGRAVVESTMKRFAPDKIGNWGYQVGLYMYAQYLVYKRTGDKRYFDYIKAWYDRFVDANGHVSNGFNNLDAMRSGQMLPILFKETGDVRYKLAADQIRKRLDTYPRTTDGGFWHATPSRDSQLWSDGVYMVLPFLATYGAMIGDSEYAFDEVTRQLLIYASHLQAGNGLLYHAYDEKRVQPWADKVTGRAPEFWCRAIGWYGMATVDVLELLPRDHPRREQLLSILRNLIAGYGRYQDRKTGRWFQVVDKGDNPANWTETSCSSMYTFTISRAVQRGYVSPLYALHSAYGYRGVLQKVSLDDQGLTNVADICIGTNVGDLPFYFARPRATNDLHGLGAFLIMNEQLRTRKF